jgi:hypothetical protein
MLTAYGLLDEVRRICSAPKLDGLASVFGDLRLYDEYDAFGVDLVAEQLERLDTFIASITTEENEPSLLDQLQNEIEASEWEDKFDGIFKEGRWQDLRVS